jgi:hypothetical protein
MLRLWGRLDCRCRHLLGPESDSEVKQTQAKVYPYLVTRVRVGRGIAHGKLFVSLSLLTYSIE